MVAVRRAEKEDIPGIVAVLGFTAAAGRAPPQAVRPETLVEEVPQCRP